MFKKVPNNNVIVAVPVFLGYIYQEEIRELFKNFATFFYDLLYATMTINRKESTRMSYAILRWIEENAKGRKRTLASDNATFSVANGEYFLDGISFTVKSEEIVTRIFLGEVSALERFATSCYKKYCAPSEVIFFYFSISADNWSIPVMRRPRVIEERESMEEILTDVRTFKAVDGPRRGYLLTGKGGTGKSTLVEHIARVYNMSIFLVSLNARDMTDATLINLVAQVEPGSLIVFEEFEKQLEAISADPNNRVSRGGILSAIDGPQRLSHGSIVILTANSVTGIDKDFLELLLRPGRIDKHFKTMGTSLNNN